MLKKQIDNSVYTIDELLGEDKDELDDILKSTLRQCQHIYDSCYDKFYCKPPKNGKGEMDVNDDPTNQSSETFTKVTNYIMNFERYNDKKLYDIVLKNKALIKQLKA